MTARQSGYAIIRTTPAWWRDWGLILRLADCLGRQNPTTFDRDRFLHLALDVFAHEFEPVVGPDPRD